MRILPIAVVASLIAQPAAACVQAVFSDASRATVCTAADACRTVLYSQLGTGSVNLRSGRLLTAIQAFLDTRLDINSFPPEDPAKAEDPGLQAIFAGRFFWSDADGNPTNGNSLTTTHVTARHCEVTAVEWDGTRFNLTISVAGP
jgi:hypothetical protein